MFMSEEFECGVVSDRSPCLRDVIDAFARPGVEPSRDHAPPGLSAVLIPIVERPHGLSVVYTRRSRTLRRHAGEVSFPGGRVDPEDASPWAAALREAHEEVGLAPADVESVGHLTDFLTYRNVLVCAYVGRVRDGVAPLRPRSLDEVEEVFEARVADLLDPARYEARRAALMPSRSQVHYWHLPEHTVWGITGELTARLLSRVWGWRPPKPAREVASVEEFRPEAFSPSV